MNYISYILWLIGEVAKSSISVTKLIWQRGYNIAPVMDFISTIQTTDAKRVIFANSITLTPGTITVSMDGDKILVHSLTEDGFRDLQNGMMDGRVCKI